MQINKWLRSPLPRDGVGREGVLACPLDDLEIQWIERAGLSYKVHGMPKAFRVWLSHDIDQLQMSYQLLTWTIAQIARGRPALAFGIIREWIRASIRQSDPFWNLDLFLEVEHRFSVRATYFFLHQRPVRQWWNVRRFSLIFGLYSMQDPKVQELVSHIKGAGGEIGIHGSVGSARSLNLLEEELELISRCGVERPIVSRQHWLDFDLWDTVALLMQAGIALDSSIGFAPPCWGFRTRTAWPHLLPAANGDGLSQVIHIPPCIMDGALQSDWRNQLDMLLKKALERHATLAVIWHNTAICRIGALDSYRWFIERASELGAEFVVGEDILRLSSISS